MTDVRARGDLGPAFDEKTPTLDRRQLIRAGAWAAPVIVLATAAPAAAQSLTLVNVPASNLITPIKLSLNSYNSNLYYALDFAYAYLAWGQGGGSGLAPGQMTVTYSVTLTKGNETIVVEQNAVGTAPAYQNFQPGWKEVTGLSKGSWKVEWSFSSVIAMPDIVGGKKFVPTGILASASGTKVVN
ncbi:hypothetical protein [uncultured Microbacterium sp.]|uniref:hypothetical protein n=1 Tax=uncultured Microbacterium sp. TaxID=191216 RepID=UPI002607E8A6|nr:hypothetical protein [uncultured Microbacterium sp.]